MKRKILFIFAGLFIFLVCFVSSVKLRDHFYEQRLRNDIKKISVGMDEAEVVEILGKPTLRTMSDIPGEYWCYDTDSINRIFLDEYTRDITCGHLLLEMSAPNNSRVVKVFEFKD